MMSPTSDQSVGLKHTEFKLCRGVQPRYGGGAHGPCINVQTDQQDEVGGATQSVVGRDHLHTIGPRGLMGQVSGSADVVEEVNKSGAFVHKGQAQPAEVLLDAVQGFDEVLKSPHAGIKRCSTLFKPSDVDGAHQPRKPGHPRGWRIGHRQLCT